MDDLSRAATEGIGNLESVGKAGKAGYGYGKDIKTGIGTLSAQAVRLNSFLVESGIYEKAGESLSESVGGPLGAFHSAWQNYRWMLALPRPRAPSAGTNNSAPQKT